MPAKRKFTDEVEQEICRRYKEGESANQIALAFGTAHPSIITILKRNGVSRRTRSESIKRITATQELAICRQYAKGALGTTLAIDFGISDTTVYKILQLNGVEIRGMGVSQRGIPLSKEPEICRLYAEGVGGIRLGEIFGVDHHAIYKALQRNGVKRRAAGGYGDSAGSAIDCTGYHSHSRDCSFYLFELANHASTHCKPGIAFDVDDRLDREYGTEALRLIYGTRQEAYFLEQAVLDATRGAAQCPAGLAGWVGASEVRAMPAEDMLPIVERLAGEMEELGVWAFAAAYVPMTAAQRATCQQRALANAPVLSSASTAE